MSDPNEYLRRITAHAAIITDNAEVLEASGLKKAVDGAIAAMLADGFRINVDSIAGFMSAAALIDALNDELAEANPIYRAMTVLAGPLTPAKMAAAVGAELSRRFVTGETPGI